MAAYASLLSLMRIIEKLHLHPHPPPISLHQKQVESLTEKISFLEEFLEAYNPHLGYSTEADPLETRIADTAYAAEDVIESHIVDRITNENMSSDGLYEGLEKVIQDMASIQKEALEIKETMRLQLHHHAKSTPHQESLRSTSTAHNSRSMVGVDDVLRRMKDELTSDYPRLQIVPIVGMGGTDPPSGSQNDIILENLQTLDGAIDFKCSEEVVKRIPNVKKLGIIYMTLDGWSCLDNLVHLHKLVSLDCWFYIKMSDSGQSLNFPQSLRKLYLRVEGSDCWQDILEKIGSLPLLEKLTLYNGCFEEGKWETVEGQFQSLKYLQVEDCQTLKQWTMESSHFPRLERLHLGSLRGLEEIPLQVAEIPTLESIRLLCCSESAATSARRIVEEQEESNGEAVIQVEVILWEKNEAVENLASHRNIQVFISG